jgi:methionyl-tRNA formyltransferase
VRLVFAGTPEPAVPTLQALLTSRHEVAAVVTRPDAASGRGRKITASPVAEVARGANVPLLQPISAKDPQFWSDLAAFEPQACPVVAYGTLLPAEVLSIPQHGWVNLHFSLLPAWRGAAPVQHAIWHGDDITGAATFQIETGLDTGPIFGTLTEAILTNDTSGDLLQRLSRSGAELMVATLDGLESGRVRGVPQPKDGISLAPKISVEDAHVAWRDPAMAIDRQVRACTPAPGAWTQLGEQRVKLGPLRSHSDQAELAPGQMLSVSKHEWIVGTGTNPLVLGDVQPQGKRAMRAADWLRGIRLEPDARFH